MGRVCVDQAFLQILDLITWLISGKKGHSHVPVENQSSELAKDEDELHIQPHCVGMCNHSGDPVEALNKWQEKAEEEIEANEREHNGTGTKASVGTGSNACNDDSIDGDGNVDTESKDVFVENCPEDREKRKLKKMGLSTALAIALHNFPEGLATFVATLQDPAVGAVLAIAIGKSQGFERQQARLQVRSLPCFVQEYTIYQKDYAWRCRSITRPAIE